jgi:putative transposase
MMNESKETGRQTLPHDIPLWVTPEREIYFITINCAERGTDQLTRPEVAGELFASIRFRTGRQEWFPHLVLLMPDHLHGLFQFPGTTKPFRDTITNWKRWTARQLGIRWQRDFFEHRLRGEEPWRQKADYILENPVRAGLASKPEEWPHVWFPSR